MNQLLETGQGPKDTCPVCRHQVNTYSFGKEKKAGPHTPDGDWLSPTVEGIACCPGSYRPV